MKSSNGSSSTEHEVKLAAMAGRRSVCPICGGAGFLRRDVPVGHPDFGKAFPCECQRPRLEAARLNDLRAMSNLEAMSRYTFDTFKPEGVGLTEEKRHNLRSAYEAARAFAANPQGWLVLLGGYGCGKTHLAAAIANEQLVLGRPVLFVVVPDLLDHLRATFSPHSPITYDRRFENIRNVQVLVLDDLGTQSSTEWAREKLFQIFNHRYNLRLPTVVTSNCKLEHIDVRIRSRLMDPDLVRICHITAPDYRSSGSELPGYELSSLELHHDQTFETFHLREHELTREQVENLRQVLTFARHYAAHPEGWLVLTGGYGTGKTHLAAAVANARRAMGDHNVLFVVVPDLLDHLRATYAPDSHVSYDTRLDQVRNAPLLILDDLGTHSATPWAQEKLYQIFNYRYNARLPTVITIADGVEVDARLKTRLFNVQRCTLLRLDVPSYHGYPETSLTTSRRRRQR
ncbi:MAG: ATP-binding protein [Anaerolineae bacterium]|nr:ATP-binding protein [Anaerolineae bacterium]MDW8069984.1 ATP-binding protein [Anaerolineae bacterium]